MEVGTGLAEKRMVSMEEGDNEKGEKQCVHGGGGERKNYLNSSCKCMKH